MNKMYGLRLSHHVLGYGSVINTHFFFPHGIKISLNQSTVLEDFCPLDCRGWIHIFRTDDAALTYKGAFPDSLMTGDDFLPGIPTLVSGVHVVPLTDGNGGGSDKGGIEGINGTGSITEHAVNTHRVLFVVSQFSRGL